MNQTDATNTIHHSADAPSSWVRRWAHLVRAGGVMLDVACGHGRHACLFYELNHPVVLVDRSQSAIESVALPPASCEKVVADIENGPWPFSGRQFDVVVVTNYLWRPLMPVLLDSLAPGGVLIYETFTQGHETVGKPSRSDFLLRTGELLEACAALRVVAFEEGFQDGSDERSARFVQRIAAVHERSAPASGSAIGAPRVQTSRYRLP